MVALVALVVLVVLVALIARVALVVLVVAAPVLVGGALLAARALQAAVLERGGGQRLRVGAALRAHGRVLVGADVRVRSVRRVCVRARRVGRERGEGGRRRGRARAGRARPERGVLWVETVQGACTVRLTWNC